MNAPVAAMVMALASGVAERQHASSDGWAAQEGGTRGGALASPANVYTVRNRAELAAALAAPAPARIVRVAGLIDMSGGRPFSDSADQARRGAVRIPSNTTLLGVAAGAGFVNGSISVSNVSQVIIRNLTLRNPCDVAPRWDPKDGPKGNWNSLFDAISVSNARQVWIDHNRFSDAPDTDDTLAVENGKVKQCHDGALDITSGSDLVSVTYNHFALHQKNSLVGGSDRATGDASRLRVTFKGNLFEHVSERAPRVRYGQVHLLNNYYLGDRKHPVYPHGYSVGVARESHIVSDANVFDVAGASACRHVVRDPGGSPGVFVDTGSLLNGQALAGCGFGGEMGWRPPYSYDALPAAAVRDHVLANAGPRLVDDAAEGYVAARLVPSATPFVLRARRDAAGNWQGASVKLIDGGKNLEVALLEARKGAEQHIKQVRRRAPLPGALLILRLHAEAGELAVYIDGERVTAARLPFVAAALPADWSGTLQDLRAGPAGTPPARIGVHAADAALPLQVGDPPERLAVAGARGALSAASANPRVASAAIVDGALVLTPLSAGRTEVALHSRDDPWVHALIAVEVSAAFDGPTASRVPRAGVQPAHGERGVPPDTPLRIRFDRSPRLSGAGSIRIIRRRDQALVAIVRPGEAAVALGPEPRRRVLRMHQIEAMGKEVRVRLPRALDYDTEYEAVAEARLVADGFQGARWRFRTTPYRPIGDSITVDDDGRAHFRTVQGALDHAMSLPRAKAVTVNVREGVYPELLYLRDKDNVTVRGASSAATVIRAANSDARNPGSGTGQDARTAGLMGGRALFLAQDSDMLELRDLTLHNTARRSDGHSAQAETIFFSNDKGRLAVRNARFVSEQDTLQLTGYAWFWRSLIEGNVDFIWGHNRAAVFEESELRTVGDSARQESGGYLVQARTVDAHDPGFVFLRSRLTSGPGPAGNLPPHGRTYLARSPGTAHTWDKVAFIQCTVGRHVADDGWLRKPLPNPPDGWREFGNTGADGGARRFGGYQMSEQEAARLSSRAGVFAGFDGGRGWDPQP